MVRAWHGRGMASVNQARLHCVNQIGKTHSKPLAARHGRGTAWAWRESAFTVHTRTELTCVTAVLYFIPMGASNCCTVQTEFERYRPEESAGQSVAADMFIANNSVCLRISTIRRPTVAGRLHNLNLGYYSSHEYYFGTFCIRCALCG
jgi:hypothetical protein